MTSVKVDSDISASNPIYRRDMRGDAFVIKV